MRALARVTPNFFTIPFGLAGLAFVWRDMTSYGVPAAVPDALFLVAGLLWVVVAASSLARLLAQPSALFADLRDPALSPFWSLPSIVGMLLAIALEPYAAGPAKIAFVAFFAATIAFGGWVTGQWIVGELDRTRLHPGYFLPTIAGGLIGGEGAADFGMHGLAWMSFGLGLVCWLLLGSVILNRLFLVARLPAALLPTLAIELAPPAVAGNAFVAIHGNTPTTVSYALAGYAVLMAFVQLRLLPIYLRLSFGPAFWAFTFSTAAAIEFALYWIHVEQPPGQTGYAALAAGSVSALVAGIGVRSVVALARGQFLPTSSTPPPDPSTAAPVLVAGR